MNFNSPLPNHGTRGRYKAPFLCRCTACISRAGKQPISYRPTWPISQLEEFLGTEVLKMWFDEGTIEEWRNAGVSDESADWVALLVGAMPNDIWSGYTMAGLDWPES